ncbi:MAG TPA: glycosyltransferase family 1 protein, partial [Woeseiaceae bacterium]|nr:glycosyltransferase family 1 protein [Woeseiaceae bacterium]
ARYTEIDLSGIVVSGAGVAGNFLEQPREIELAAFRRDFDLPPRFILSVARVRHGADRRMRSYPGANTPRLLRAWLRYRRKGGDLPLVMVGRDIEGFLRAQGFDESELRGVHFPGFIPNDRMHLAYRSARCFAIATLCESFGITILEALTSGCPAIAPNTCAAPEVAGGAARLIDPLNEDDIAEALLEVAGSDALCVRMRERGFEQARKLSWQECARQTLRVFDSVVGSPLRHCDRQLETPTPG